jgi:hypothetical protein
MRITGNSEIQVNRGDFWTAKHINFSKSGSPRNSMTIQHHFWLTAKFMQLADFLSKAKKPRIIEYIENKKIYYLNNKDYRDKIALNRLFFQGTTPAFRAPQEVPNQIAGKIKVPNQTAEEINALLRSDIKSEDILQQVNTEEGMRLLIEGAMRLTDKEKRNEIREEIQSAIRTDRDIYTQFHFEELLKKGDVSALEVLLFINSSNWMEDAEKIKTVLEKAVTLEKNLRLLYKIFGELREQKPQDSEIFTASYLKEVLAKKTTNQDVINCILAYVPKE